jgi:hypothetical protein
MSYRVYFKELPDKLSGMLLLARSGVEVNRPLSLKRTLASPAAAARPKPEADSRDAPALKAPQKHDKKPVQRNAQKPPGPALKHVAEEYVEDPRRPMTIRDVHQGWGRKA